MKSSPLVRGPNGRHHSKKSKTGDPKCSAAVSAWVLGRKTGGVAAEVFQTLARCRAQAKQNKSAKAKQASGKLAEGRGTWQRSEKAAQLHQARASSRPSPSPVAARPTVDAKPTRSPADVVAHARSVATVHALNPAAPMTTHNPHAANASKADAGFSLQGGNGKTHNNGAAAFFDTGKGHGKRAPLFGLDDLPTNSARGQGSLFGGKMHDPNAGISGTTGRRVEVGADGQHRLPGNFSAAKPEVKASHLSGAPTRVEPPPIGRAGKIESREGRLAALVGKLRGRTPRPPEKPLDPSTHTNHEPGHVGHLDTGLIHVDANRFQYKIGFGEGGSVGSLAGVRRYDPELGGVLQVWKDHGDGKVYVVNGHNRLDLANKLGADKVTVRFIAAKDHAEARAKGALTNIAEGRGTATDAAKFFRDTGVTREALEARGIPLREKVATDGLSLSRLDDHVFKRVTSGEITPERGAIIGGAGLEHHEQRALVSLLDKRAGSKGGEVNNATLRELTDTVRSSRSVRKESHDLFGSNADDESLALHKATLQAKIKDRLGKEKKLFGIVAKSSHAQDLARAGNTINTHESGKISHDAAVTLHAFDSMKNLSGPVSRRLNDAAERIHKGENAKKVTDETYRGILRDLPEMLRGGNVFAA